MLALARRWLDGILQVVTIGLLLGLAVLVIAAVGFRKAGESIIWYDEVASVLLAWLTFLGAALAVLRHAHLGFPGLVFRLPLALRVPCFALAKLIVAGFWVTVLIAGGRALDLMVGDALVTLPWLSVQVVQGVLPVAAVLIIAAELLDLPESLARLRRGVDDETQEIQEAVAEGMARSDTIRAGLHEDPR
ncbi:MAG: TRAP transporter small permease subunit [Casimicrobiaceae bacterium]